MDYRILTSPNKNDLASEVRHYITEEGYKLQGGVSVSITDLHILYAQAVVKD